MLRKNTAALLALTLFVATPAQADEKDWNDAGTIARDALVVAALGLPVVKGDWDGALQAGGSIGATTLTTIALKEAFPTWRPDRSDRKSFPSGHTSTSFAAAATLHNRYGWEVGLPAYAVASFVGVSRVEAKKHRWGDVLAGAAIGVTAGHLITKKRDDGVVLIPWGDTKSAGVSMAMKF